MKLDLYGDRLKLVCHNPWLCSIDKYSISIIFSWQNLYFTILGVSRDVIQFFHSEKLQCSSYCNFIILRGHRYLKTKQYKNTKELIICNIKL